MRHTTTSRNNDIIKSYNSGAYAFSIRGQQYVFPTRDEYLEAFSHSLDIAKEQERQIESQMDIEEALEDSGQEKQYELNFETGHLSNGDECSCGNCVESERSVESK